MSMKLSALLNPTDEKAVEPTPPNPTPTQTAHGQPQDDQRPTEPARSEPSHPDHTLNTQLHASNVQQQNQSATGKSDVDMQDQRDHAFEAANTLAALANGSPAVTAHGPSYATSQQDDLVSNERHDGPERSVKAARHTGYETFLAGAANMARDGATDPELSVNGNGSLPGPSRTVEIKQEPQTSYQLVAGADSTVDRKMDKPDLDEATQRAIKEAQNEYSTRRRPPKAAPSDLVPTASVVSPRASPPAPSPKSQPAPSKKRPAPKNSSTTSTAKAKAANAKKPPPKKLKLGPSDNGAPAIGTPSSQGARSATPTSASGRKASVSKQTSTTNAPRKASKSAASADPDGEASSDSDSGMIYCICRKPDNHTWMIGCDGPCEDWFHGKCVDLAREDEDLLDKYICPNCEAGGIGVTTWKPMCRRDGCRKPARLKKGGESKYCTDECGLAFMREALGRAGALNYKGGRNNMPQQRRKSSTAKAKPRSPREDEQQSEEDELDIGPLGGRLRAPELKSLVHSVPDAASFRRLGSPGILTPPATASPERDDPTIGDSPIATRRDDTSDNGDLTEQEAARLGEIAERKADLRRRRGIVQDRERVVNMVKERAGRSKDQCGFDERLAWDEERFEAWRNCTSGRAVFEKGTLDAEDEMHPHVKSEGEGAGANTPAAATTTTTTTTCKLTKKKCHRHGQWQKIVLQDVRFEKADVGDEMRRVDREERQIREEAGARGRVQGRSSRKGLSWESERDYGGSVEVVGQ